MANNSRHIEGQWLPTTKKEIEHLGWEHIDVILFTGDAYIDHPSMGTAVIGRTLEAHGYKVAVVPQPNWRDDLRDFKKLGKPRLFFGVSAGLLVSALPRHQVIDRKTRGVRNIFTRHLRGANVMARKNAAIGNAELCHQFFFPIMRHKSYVHTFISIILIMSFQLPKSRNRSGY